MKKMNIFHNIDNSTSDEIFETLLVNRKVKLERIISNGYITPKEDWYDQNNDEWVILLKGEATLLFANKDSIALTAGDYLEIKAGVKHKVTFTSKDAIWLAIHIK